MVKCTVKIMQNNPPHLKMMSKTKKWMEPRGKVLIAINFM